MHLGDLIARLGEENDAALALESLGDMMLFAEVQDVGAWHDETPGEYVAAAARRFAALASDEDWLSVMNALERADEPSKAVLDRMLRWAIARDRAEAAAPEDAPRHAGCGCGGGGGGCGGHGHGH